MYYQDYEDYMRSVLGYPPSNQNTYQVYNSSYENMMIEDTRDLEEMYPDIFKTLKPVIEDACSKCDLKITNEVLEDMVDSIYQRIDNNEINVNINVINDSNINSGVREAENRGIRRKRPNNQLLRDLIKILLINQLINANKRPNMPHRPSMPPRPMPRGEFDNYLRF